jgi:hypothetical protein
MTDLVEAPPGRRIRDENERLSLNPFDLTIALMGRVRHVAPTPSDYAAAGVDVTDRSPASAKILRFLAATIPEQLFASDDELLEVCGRGGAGLQKFLELDEWRHPDTADGELPSESPCLVSLARALSANDTALYECSAESFNTHWSNWEEIYTDE